MNENLKFQFYTWIRTILIILVIGSRPSQLSAQANDNINQKTILKSWNTNNRYTTSQAKWLQKKGFQTQKYNWDNVGIESHIDKAFKIRETGQGLAIISGLGILLSSQLSGDGIGEILLLSTVTGLFSYERFNAAKIKVANTEVYRKSILQQLPKEGLEESNDEILTNSFPILPSPYSETKNYWLDRKNFSIDEYNWQDPEINEKIKEAFKLEKNANMMILAPIGIVLGYLTYLVINDLYSGRLRDGSKPNKGIIYASVSIPLLISLITKGEANKKLREAEYLRKTKR